MRKNFNTTIDEETIAAIERLAVNGKSKGAVVDEAVALMVNRSKASLPDEATVNRWFRETWSRLDEILEFVGQPPESQVLAEPEPPKRTIADPAALMGVPIQCKHCGQVALGPTKFATICFECKTEGHTLAPADCPICTAGTGL